MPSLLGRLKCIKTKPQLIYMYAFAYNIGQSGTNLQLCTANSCHSACVAIANLCVHIINCLNYSACMQFVAFLINMHACIKGWLAII